MLVADKSTKARHVLPDLPYSLDALEPFMSRETLEYHYGKHHKGYVDRLNSQIRGTPFEGAGLDQVVKRSTGAIFNNAAQAWNHNFFWNCLDPRGGEPSAVLGKMLERAFGSVDAFKQLFRRAALEKFGSGWIWLARLRDGQLVVRSTDGADNPLTTGDAPLLTCDVWEHAYYIDYRNDRAKYLDAYWKLVNWKFLEENFEAAMQPAPHAGAPRVSRR